jgi:DNA-binding phage protein
MALTRKYRETVLERIRTDPEFTAAMYAEAVTAIIEGDRATALSILRDLVHAHITFKVLAEQTGFGEKALHRMLGVGGNPTAKNLALLMHTIAEDLQLSTSVESRWVRPRRKSGNQRQVSLAYA